MGIQEVLKIQVSFFFCVINVLSGHLLDFCQDFMWVRVETFSNEVERLKI